MHDDDASGSFEHPSDETLDSEIVNNYNTYVGTGDLSGSFATSYDSLVPFQTNNSTNYTSLSTQANSDGSVTTGPSTSDRVFCLTCHRAHASGWKFITRWDNETELIIVDGEWPGTDAGSPLASDPKWAKGRRQAERARAYNDTRATDYAIDQRVLCEKCHGIDEQPNTPGILPPEQLPPSSTSFQGLIGR
jgi:hypothetical protein